jgi:hypothetical protein
VKNPVFIALVLMTTLFSCAKPDGDNRLREKAEIEADAGQNQIDKKAQEMEERLARQQRFFQGVAGEFTGSWRGSDMTFHVKFIITPSLPAYDGSRTRSMDEITFDLTNLTLAIEETTSWKRRDSSSTGCNYALLKPRTDSGFIHATNGECPVSFTLSVLESGSEKAKDVSKIRERASRKLLDGEIDRIDSFRVEMRSIHRPGVEVFTVTRSGN